MFVRCGLFKRGKRLCLQANNIADVHLHTTCQIQQLHYYTVHKICIRSVNGRKTHPYNSLRSNTKSGALEGIWGGLMLSLLEYPDCKIHSMGGWGNQRAAKHDGLLTVYIFFEASIPELQLPSLQPYSSWCCMDACARVQGMCCAWGSGPSTLYQRDPAHWRKEKKKPWGQFHKSLKK